MIDGKQKSSHKLDPITGYERFDRFFGVRSPDPFKIRTAQRERARLKIISGARFWGISNRLRGI